MKEHHDEGDSLLDTADAVVLDAKTNLDYALDAVYMASDLFTKGDYSDSYDESGNSIAYSEASIDDSEVVRTTVLSAEIETNSLDLLLTSYGY